MRMTLLAAAIAVCAPLRAVGNETSIHSLLPAFRIFPEQPFVPTFIAFDLTVPDGKGMLNCGFSYGQDGMPHGVMNAYSKVVETPEATFVVEQKPDSIRIQVTRPATGENNANVTTLSYSRNMSRENVRKISPLRQTFCDAQWPDCEQRKPSLTRAQLWLLADEVRDECVVRGMALGPARSIGFHPAQPYVVGPPAAPL